MTSVWSWSHEEGFCIHGIVAECRHPHRFVVCHPSPRAQSHRPGGRSRCSHFSRRMAQKQTASKKAGRGNGGGRRGRGLTGLSAATLSGKSKKTAPRNPSRGQSRPSAAAKGKKSSAKVGGKRRCIAEQASEEPEEDEDNDEEGEEERVERDLEAGSDDSLGEGADEDADEEEGEEEGREQSEGEGGRRCTPCLRVRTKDRYPMTPVVRRSTHSLVFYTVAS